MNLFAYGTLMDPAVWDRVAQESCRTAFAALAGHEVRRLKGHPFPGLIEVAGAIAPGLVYFDVSPEAMARLDAYEDDFYVRIPATVTLRDGGSVHAQVYLMAHESRNLVESEKWVPGFPVGGEHWT